MAPPSRSVSGGGRFCNLLPLGLGTPPFPLPRIQSPESYSVLDEQTGCCWDDVRSPVFKTRAIFLGIYVLGPDTLLARPSQ
jgi:hypothetical protein